MPKRNTTPKRFLQDDSCGLTESMQASPREETKRSQQDRSKSGERPSNRKESPRSEADEQVDETYTSHKKSRMSATLLSNFILGITLLKNISLRFSEPGKFYDEFDSSMNQLIHVEKILYSLGSLDASLPQNEDLKGFEIEEDATEI